MTASQFIKIMLALKMTAGEVNAMLDGRRPKIEELSEVAREMADDVPCGDDGPTPENRKRHFQLLQIANDLEN